LSSLAIDPDIGLPSTPFSNRATGAITPAAYSTFSSTVVNSAPMWIITNPKNTLLYTYLLNGRFVSHTSGLASETNIGTPTSGAGNGMNYYNNFIYLMTPTDVSRYGPLDGTPTLTNTVWTGSTLGTQTALTNTTYPSFASTAYPNHAGHVHTDNALYFGDFINGQGLIHKIITSKVTDEGDTNNGSSYNVLDLPFGYMPMDIESYGTDLAIVAIQTSDTTFNQGNAALFLWDTFASTFYMQIPIENPLVSAIFNKNGVLNIFSGNRNNGFKVSQYIGGYSFHDIDFFEEGYSPYAAAVDGYGSRISLGSKTTDPATALTVYGLGYKSPHLPENARHSIARPASSGTNPVITAIKYAQQASGITPRLLIGWADDSATAIDSLGGTPNSVFRSEVFTSSKPFSINSIRFGLSEAVGANTTIGVIIFYDKGTTTKTLNTVNSTNFTNSERVIHYKAAEIEEASTTNFKAQTNFFLQFTQTGTDLNTILLPIEIETVEYED